MPSSEVDRIAKVYDGYRDSGKAETHWSDRNLGNRLMLRERRRVMEELLAQSKYLPLDKRRILDVGCGDGHVLAGLKGAGASEHNLYGVDLLPSRIENASRSYPNIAFQQANAERLPFRDAEFDIVLAFTVFSSISSGSMAHNVAREMTRILHPDGAIVWYDIRYNNPFNPNVRGLRQGDIQRLFPGFDFAGRSITLLPPLARRLSPRTEGLYNLLSRLRPLRTHYMGLLRRT